MIFLGLGTNLGDRHANLEASLRALSTLMNIHQVSSVYESAALLPENAPAEWDISYYNSVICGESSLSPEELLMAIKNLEKLLGRKDIGRWGPRLIDMDMLSYGALIHQSDNLILPHPEMTKRDFVMVPLAEIAPQWKHPVMHKSAAMIVKEQAMGSGDGLKRLTTPLRWRG